MPPDLCLLPCGGTGPAPLDWVQIAPSMDDVRRTMERICARLEDESLDADTLGRVEIVLSEVLNNVVEHAQRDRPHGKIEVALNACANRVCLQVMDDGAPMPGGLLPGGVLPDLEVDVNDLPEGGFGWYMIRSVADELRYRRSDTGNSLCICIFRPDPLVPRDVV